MRLTPPTSGYSSPQSEPEAAGQTAGPVGGGNRLDPHLQTLSDVAIRHVASHLRPRGVASLSAVDKSTRKALAEPRRAALMSGRAQTVSTPAAFLQLLGPAGTPLTDGSNGIRSLHPSLQAAPLSALAMRIGSIPPGHEEAVITQFLAVFEALPEENRSTALTVLARVAGHSTVEFGARGAARHGANVEHAALFYGITDAAQISQLESEAAWSHAPGSAGAGVRGGRSVQDVAREFGVVTQGGMEALEHASIRSPEAGSAGAAARGGENVQAIAQRFGISSQHGIRRLENEAAQSDAPGSAAEAARSASNVRDVVARFGFTSHQGIATLESAAARSNVPGSAGHSVRNGMSVQDAYDAFGFTSAEGRRELDMVRAAVQNAQYLPGANPG